MSKWDGLRQDLSASVVVFFVALPLCLGIALASGAPMMAGLVAGVIGGIVVGAISRSRLGVSGPAAGLTVIVLGAIETLGSFEAFLVAVVLAGIIQMMLGMLRAGVLAYFKLARPALFRKMWSFGPEQFLPFMVTVTGVVFIDLLSGVVIGMALAALLLLQRNYRNSHFLHLTDNTGRDEHHVITMQLAEEVTFLNKRAITKELNRIPEGSELAIDKRGCVYINHDVAEIIDEFVEVAPSRRIQVSILEAREQPDARGVRPAAFA